MDLAGLAAQSLLSPLILFFLLGLFAGLARSCLTIPEVLSKGISLYLMIAIGFRGGVELSHAPLGGEILAAVGAAIALSATLPLVANALLRRTTRVDPTTAAAVAAHYGSVSVVTFAAAIAILNHQGVTFEPYLVALVAVMEAPAILTGLVLARRGAARAAAAGAPPPSARAIVKDVLLHGSVVLLLGSFLIGWATGPAGLDELGAVFVTPFKGVLAVFLLEMGLLVARRLPDLRAVGLRVVAFGLYMPVVGAAIGLAVALVLGLSPGGATLLAVLCASASYIVVPAVMRAALPQASPAIYLTLALGITFPFNLIVGIPVYGGAARVLARAAPPAEGVARAPGGATTAPGAPAGPAASPSARCAPPEPDEPHRRG